MFGLTIGKLDDAAAVPQKISLASRSDLD